jgi:conjugative transposon TraM protein
MQKIQRSQAFLRKRKMMLVMPLLAIPFITMAFWALGGGKGSQHSDTGKSPGLNLNLPEAQLKDDAAANKLSFYDKADKDSMKLQEQMRNDPYYSLRQDSLTAPVNEIEQMTMSTASKYNQKLNPSPYDAVSNNPEQKLLQKLALLEKQMNNPEPTTAKTEIPDNNSLQDDEFNNQVSKLENMMQTMSEGNTEDHEIKQLGNTLDKILDIQHPQRVKDRLKEKSLQQKEIVFAVATTPQENNISLLDTSKKRLNNNIGFFGLDENQLANADDNAIEAVVHANQVLVNGAIIKLRLTTNIYVNGVLVPKGSFVFGQAALNNERLNIEVETIRSGNSLFPVKLDLYDMDGMAGIYIPGTITRDVAKQSADNGLQLMELTSVDPSLKMQAAAAGINTAKNLISRRVKQVKVLVKAGYKVLLKNKQ